MSTGKKNVTAQRIALISAKNEKIFHTSDLGNLWLVKNKNTLYTLLKRYTQSGILKRIYKGLYSLVPIEELDPFLIGAKAIHRYCYISTETILYREAYISQKPNAYTFVSEKSLHFQIGEHSYRSRQLNPQYLFNPDGIVRTDEIFMATPERAIADMLYFNPFFYFDKKIDWKKIRAVQKKVGYPLTPERYDFTKTK